MNRTHNPSAIAPPFNNRYSHAVETVEEARHLFISGQIGVKPDGSIDADVEGQSEQIMENLREILASAGMGFADLVKINAYLLNAEDIPKFAAIRARHLDGGRPAMTTVVVTALAAPQWLIEVEAVAAKRG
ncbi:RidA family protein [Arenibaculum sp.]|jgi:enamine deaminase RidA (YjgF/YER057c/UK114 family)|uniref:RidA family protein n=1 Tax=Arenibaculum sp. TaxID=2865862 RepID=UPI002E1435B7|nr:RidA family protein [Arenibaculum sp.]